MKLTSYYKEGIRTNDPQIINWRENNLGDSLYYSYRTTRYDRASFPSRLHCHDYFELVIFEEGDIHYICESETYQPQGGDVLVIHPGAFHMSAIRCDETLYKRHVFYLYPDALDAVGCNVLTAFLRSQKFALTVLSLDEPVMAECGKAAKVRSSSLGGQSSSAASTSASRTAPRAWRASTTRQGPM